MNLINNKFQPEQRFSDTTYMIHKQWKVGNVKSAFPTVFKYENRIPEGNNNAETFVKVDDDSLNNSLENDNDIRNTTKLEIEIHPIPEQHSLKIDENGTDDDKVEGTIVINPVYNRHRKDCPFPVEIKHKQFHYVDETDKSSNDESDDYSIIELRKVVSYLFLHKTFNIKSFHINIRAYSIHE